MELDAQEASVGLLRSLVERHPTDPRIHANLLYALHHTDGNSGSLLRMEHSAWAARHAERLSSSNARHDNERSSDRRLRIAYVSADFREHPASRFLLPLVSAHHRTEVEVVCYSDVQEPNPLTELFKAASDKWCETAKISDE